MYIHIQGSVRAVSYLHLLLLFLGGFGNSFRAVYMTVLTSFRSNIWADFR